jgi:hypothetical protein
MSKQEYLMTCADEFLRLLKKYANEDGDVQKVLEFFLPWYGKVKKGVITPPCYNYTLNVYFTNPDISSIAQKYFYDSGGTHELSIAAANFWAAMYDRVS